MRRVQNRVELFAQLPRGSTGAELGVLDGLFSAQILKVVCPHRLYLVDLWRSTVGIQRPDSTGKWQVCELPGPESWRCVQERLAEEIESGKVQLICAEANSWLASMPPNSLDWVYLDDDHRFHHVMAELESAATCVRAGGWIMGHDYCAVLPGVAQAVDAFCQDCDLEIEFLTDEVPLPVYPRLDWMPETCAYNSFAIRLPGG